MTNDQLLQGRCILLVEDDYLVAEVLTEMLEAGGARVLGPFGWRDKALAFVDRNNTTFDAVVLDVHLHGQTSYPIADVLIERAIHFVFMTGYGASVLKAAYRGHSRCEKPFKQQTLFAALAAGLPIRPAPWLTSC